MERIGRPVQGRGLDVAVLPIGDLFTMGPDDAVEAVRLLKPKLALPSHYGTWPPIEQDAIAWARRVEAAGLAAAKAPAVGEPITIG
jgi:L-ascorbate metabolism protein UlaG (beta-lactamase superfamily)